MSRVTEAPGVQKVGEVPIVERALPRTKEVCVPGCRMKEFVSKIRGLLAVGVPDGPPIDQTAAPPDTMLQGAAQAGAVVLPVSVPAKTTWHVDWVQDMALPPLFLIDIEMAMGEEVTEGPAFKEASTTATLELAVALLTRL
jgi:hypothetical protein